MQEILLLHGAIGAADQLEPLAGLLGDDFRVHSFSFAGHGGSAMPEEPLSIRLFAEEVLSFLDARKVEAIDIFGYSMGGYVAMYLARHYPQRVKRVVTLATKFHWDEPTAVKEQKMLDAEKIAAKLPEFAAGLAARHAPNDWKQLLARTTAMLGDMGRDNPLKAEDYPVIQHQALVLLGDRDQMITLEETLEVYKALPNGSMGMLPRTKHPIEQVNLPALAFMIRSFLQG